MEQPNPDVGAAIITSGDRVLVGMKLKDNPVPFQFPAGKQKAGEDISLTALRETKEEAGLIVVLVNSEPIHMRPHPTTGANMYYFHCKVEGGQTPHNLKPDEMIFEWVPIRDIKLLMPTIADEVYAYLQEKVLDVESEGTLVDTEALVTGIETYNST